MSFRPRTAEQIFLANVLVRVVEGHLLRRKVRQSLRLRPGYSFLWKPTLEKLDRRIDFLARQCVIHSNNGVKEADNV